MLADGFGQANNGNKSVLNGVYTAAQAERGKLSFGAHCSACHGEDLSGKSAVALKGEKFMDHWREDTLEGLFNFVSKSMPPRLGGSLGDNVYIDIVSHILKTNEFPEGTDELTPNMTRSIKVVGKSGAAVVPEFSLVQVVGCLTQAPDKTWILTNSSEPVRTRIPNEPPADEIKAAAAIPLGTQTFGLLYVDFFRPGFIVASHTGHKMEAKGFLIQKPDPRLSITWLEMLDSNCAK
jgi:mono/diheme cytochrome c family protein